MLCLFVAALYAPTHVLADSTGEQAPATTSGAFTNASNAFVCDGMDVATATANNQKQTYWDYGFNLPPSAVVTGIQVRVRATDGASNNRKLQVSLSWDGGTTFTANLNTRNFRKNALLKNFIVGGSAVLWGHAWTPSELSNGSFRVRLNAKRNGSDDDIRLDCVPVTVFYRIPGAPSLTIAKTDSPDPVEPLQEITYTITYSNTGESTATNVIISDVIPAIPAHTTFVSASPAPLSAPSVGSTGTVTWNVGSVPFGGSGAVTLTVQVNSGLSNGTQITNDAYSIASDQNSPTPGDPVQTTVQGTIVLSLTKSDDPDPVAPGTALTYVLTITNNGNVAATNITVNEAYDGNVAFASQSSSGSCASFGGNPDNDQWTIGSLGAGLSCEITVETTVNSPLVDGVLLTNVADLIDGAGNTAEAAEITTVDNPAVCGDGIIKAPEVCDEGGANGTPGSCCTATCTLRSSGEVCRPAVGDCDVQETCSGSSATCPADGFVSAGESCTDDGNVCTDDECDGAGVCAHPNNTAPCSDGDACTSVDVCSDGACVGGPAPDCNDNNACTDDGCNPASGCTHTNNSDPCNDGDACTTGDACSGGACAGGPPPNCNDNDVCTDDGCNPASGCTHTNNTDPCDDGDGCTTADACSGGTCVGGSAPSCDDGNTCTNDSCVSPTGCAHAAIGGCCNFDSQCADTDHCTTSERCESHACVSDPVNCSDNNDCTDDGCNPGTGCTHTDNNDPCDDDDACTTADACSGSGCVGGPALDCNDNDGCTDDGCNAGSGCGYTNNTAACDDGSFCTQNDVCSGGDCQGGPAPDCDDANTCTDDDCNPGSGCTHPYNTASCSDGLFCNGTDTCSSGSCSVHAGDPCTTEPECNNECNETADNCLVTAGTPCTDEGNVCTDDACDGAGSCGHSNNILVCDDGSTCSLNDVCADGLCAGTSVECGDGTLQAGCAEQCDDGNRLDGDGCSNACQLEACGPEPATSCVSAAPPGSALIRLSNSTDNRKDSLIWKWRKGPDILKDDFGNPLVDSNYQFCIYRNTAPKLMLTASALSGGMCAGRPCWKETRKGFLYKNKDLTANGLTKIMLRSGAAQTAKILVKGRDARLAMPDLTTLTSPVTVQLIDRRSNNCWEATYSFPPGITTSTKFKDKTD